MGATSLKGNTMANAKSKVATIQVVKTVASKVSYRTNSARAKWFEAIQAYNGKPVSEFVAGMQENAPSQPTKGKLKGQTEPPMGWVNFFQRQGIIKINQA